MFSPLLHIGNETVFSDLHRLIKQFNVSNKIGINYFM